jgi:hypothetical protein
MIVDISPSLRAHVMRWSRLLNSSAAALQYQVEVELRGIPIHAWDLASMETLLNEWCWITEIHPVFAHQREVFRVIAWCSSSSSIPKKLHLEIIEPLVTDRGGGGLRRSLSYPIEVLVLIFDRPGEHAPPLRHPHNRRMIVIEASCGGVGDPGGRPLMTAILIKGRWRLPCLGFRPCAVGPTSAKRRAGGTQGASSVGPCVAQPHWEIQLLDCCLLSSA